MGLMQSMVTMMGEKKREELMTNMMPMMMDGIDLHEFMPKMMGNMLKELTAEDIVLFMLNGVVTSNAHVSPFYLHCITVMPCGITTTRIMICAMKNIWYPSHDFARCQYINM